MYAVARQAGDSVTMPLYMDVHDVPGAKPEDLARAHEADLSVQHKHGVQCLKYWLNESRGKVFCLFEAPSAEAANAVHREAHGLLAEKIIEVDPEVADGLLGNGEVDDKGAVRTPGDRQRDTGIRSIMFTDIVGSTEACSRYGDDAAMAMLNLHDTTVRAALADHDGREVKHTGDGIMAAFLSSAGAVRSACQIQQTLAKRSETESDMFAVTLRIGISAGEPVDHHDDLFGSAVQLASRLCARAEPGQILVSTVVADLCLGKGLKFRDAGETMLKGFDAPVATRAVELCC